MRKVHRSTLLPLGMVFFFAAFIFFNNCLWVIKDDFIHHPDAHKHVKYSVHFYSGLRDLIFEKDIGLKTFQNFLALFSPEEKPQITYKVLDEAIHPKLVYFFAALTTMIFGLSMNILKMSNIIYAVILILALYHIGKTLGNKNAGLFAGLITFMYPGMFVFSRYLSNDFPLTAMVALSSYLLIRTENFKDVRYSILFGLAFGLGILTKLQMVFFFIGPLGYLLIRMIIKKKDFVPCLRNFFIAFGLALLLSSPHWSKSIPAFRVYLAWQIGLVSDRGAPEVTLDPFSFDWFFFYINQSIVYLSPLFFMAFIIGSIVFFNSKIKEKFLLLWWIIGGYLIFTLVSAKSGRYYLPALPSFALISSFGILGLRNKRIKFFIVTFLILFGINQWMSLSFGISLFPKQHERLTSFSIRKIEKVLPFVEEWKPGSYAPRPRKNNYEEVARTFIKEINPERRSKILLISERYYGPTELFIESLLLIERPDLLSMAIHNWDVGEVNEAKEFGSDYIITIGDVSTANLNKLEIERGKVYLLQTDLLLPPPPRVFF